MEEQKNSLAGVYSLIALLFILVFGFMAYGAYMVMGISNSVNDLESSVSDIQESVDDMDVKGMDIDSDSMMMEDSKAESKDASTKKEVEVLVDTFKYSEKNGVYYGNLVAEGYVSTEKVDEFFCEENCEEFTYAFFNVTNSQNEVLDDFFAEQKGNAFVKNNAIGLGCVENGVLSRLNIDTGSNLKTNTLSKADSKIILDSPSNSTIQLELKKYIHEAEGFGVPACFSQFDEISIIK